MMRSGSSCRIRWHFITSPILNSILSNRWRWYLIFSIIVMKKLLWCCNPRVCWSITDIRGRIWSIQATIQRLEYEIGVWIFLTFLSNLRKNQIFDMNSHSTPRCSLFYILHERFILILFIIEWIYKSVEIIVVKVKRI